MLNAGQRLALLQRRGLKRGRRDALVARVPPDCTAPSGWHAHADCHLFMRADLAGNVWEVRQSPRGADAWWCLRFDAAGTEPLERWGAFTKRDMALRRASDREAELNAQSQWPPAIRGARCRILAGFHR